MNVINQGEQSLRATDPNSERKTNNYEIMNLKVF